MRILTRYVLAELVKMFLVSLAALTGLMIVVGVVREAAAQNLPLGQVVRLLPYILPDALRFSMPATLLLATTTVYGRMSGSNEIVAAKALGISPMALVAPALVLSFLVSLVTVWLNDVAVSWGRNGARRVVVEAAEDIAYSMLRAQKSYSSNRFSINVKRVEGRRLIRPTLTLEARGRTPAMTFTAEEAELQSDRREGVLRIFLQNSTMHIDGKMTVQYPGFYEREIPLHDASRANTSTGVPSWLSLQVIPRETELQREEIERTEQEMAARAAYQMLSGDLPALQGPDWEQRAKDYRGMWNRLHRLETEPHRRWSAGFTCLCFVWVGVPMAIRLRNRDFLTSFFLCFLPILIVYYPLLAYGVDGAKNGTIPPQSVWAGNVLLGLWGLWVLRKVIRY